MTRSEESWFVKRRRPALLGSRPLSDSSISLFWHKAPWLARKLVAYLLAADRAFLVNPQPHAVG
jgi:hypothetical protein